MLNRLLRGLVVAIAFICGVAPDVAFGVTMRSGVSTTLTGNQDRRPFDWRSTLEMLDPDLAPFTHLLMKLERKKTDSVKFYLFEDDDVPIWGRINYGNGYNSSATSMVTDDGTVFFADARVLVSRTGEIFSVGSVSTNTLNSITRGIDGTTAAAILDNDWLLVLGEIVYEGDDIGTIRSSQPTTVYNYVEIFRKAYGYTKTNEWERKRGPNDPTRDRMIALREIKRQIEYAFRFGSRTESGTHPNIIRRTGGLEYFCTNVANANGSLSEPFMLAVCEKAFRYGDRQNKLCFVGRDARLQLDGLGLAAATVIDANDSKNWLGMEISMFRSSFGTLRMVTDHSLGYGYAARMHVIDASHVNIKVGRDLQHLTDRQGNGEDQVKNEFLMEAGLQLDTPLAHMIVKGAGVATA